MGIHLPAHMAAVMAARLTAWPPNGAARIEKTPVVAKSGRDWAQTH